MSNNAFMASAKKSQREQKVIQQAERPDNLVCINIRIPESMRTKIRMHYVETDENMTVLINRLLEEELG